MHHSRSTCCPSHFAQVEAAATGSALQGETGSAVQAMWSDKKDAHRHMQVVHTLAVGTQL